MVHQPLPSLESWVSTLSQTTIPVLKRTARDLARLRADEDRLTGRQVAAAILHDPLMTLHVLAYIEATRRKSQTTDITTIDRAVMMIGITPFFEKFSELPVVEDHLKAYPQALIGLLQVIARARQASLLARDWAVIRHDLDIEEITVAALLHDSAEILLWCFAPKLMMDIRTRQALMPSLRSAAAQKEVIGFTISDLQLALARTWHLPELLQTLMDEKNVALSRVRNVLLAVNLSRHLAHGWADPAIPDDLADIGKLLGLSEEVLVERLQRLLDIAPVAQSSTPAHPPASGTDRQAE